MRSLFLAFSFTVLALVGACAPPAPAEIAWLQGDVEDAFAEASESGKPVLLYWGAEWCPPCNRLKAGLFHDAAFVAQTRDFVPVYLDGDSRGAQLWGEQFAIQGYPTLIILRPDRAEIMRLSGGGDPERFERALSAARQSQNTVADLIQRAQTNASALSAQDWTLLGEYGWEVDANRVVDEGARAGVLRQLAVAAPDPALARRFELLALTELEPGAALPAEQRARAAEALRAVLANRAETRANRDTLIYGGATLLQLVDASARPQLQSALFAALDAVFADGALPISDRLAATYPELELHRANAGETAAVPAALLAKVRERAAWADATAQTPYERQAAISDAADLLAEAGDLSGAERLLTAELPKSATPFYYMPSLADLAEQQGDTTRALDWYRRGYETAIGPASRAQWGIIYATGQIRLAPHDKAAIEQAVTAIIDELANPDSYHQRTRQRFARLETALRDWSATNDGADVLARLRAHMVEVCPAAQSDAGARDACAAWLA